MPTSSVTLTDYQGYASGSYMAYVSPWNHGSYKQGVDYTESIDIDTGMFPNSVVINSNWGSKASNSVYGFNGIDFGDYNGTKVPTPVPSMQLKTIGTLTETHDMTLAGQTSGFDVIDDMFLTARPGSLNPHVAEIEVFLHTPSYSSALVQYSKPIGTFTSGGVTWTVAVTKGAMPDYLFMPSNQADVTSATVDVKSMFDYLVGKGALTGNEYFNGLAIGEETQQGSGTTTINAFSVNYQAASSTSSPPASSQPTSSPSTPTSSAPTSSAPTSSTANVTVALKNDSGVSSTDHYTNDPTLTGTAAANATITVKDGALTLGSTTADAKGLWTLKPSNLADGQHQNLIVTADNAGKVATASVGVYLDTKPAGIAMSLAHDTGTSTTDKITNDPTLTGGTTFGAQVTLSENGKTIATVTASTKDGSWSFKPTGLGDGTHTIVATELDTAGNAATASTTFTLKTAVAPLSLGLKNDTGSSATDHVTMDPTLVGHAGANAIVTFMEGQRTLGAVTADANGSWSYLPSNLADGSHSIVATERDVAGNTATSTLGITLNTKAPAISAALQNDTGASHTDKVTSDATLTGSTLPGAKVTIYNHDAVVGTTLASAKGGWSFSPSDVVAGSNTYVAKVADLAGNVGSATTHFTFSAHA